MAFLIAVEIRDLTEVTPLLFLLWDLGIGVHGRGLFVLFLPTVLEFFLLILPVFFVSRLRYIIT